MKAAFLIWLAFAVVVFVWAYVEARRSDALENEPPVNDLEVRRRMKELQRRQRQAERYGA